MKKIAIILTILILFAGCKTKSSYSHLTTKERLDLGKKKDYVLHFIRKTEHSFIAGRTERVNAMVTEEYWIDYQNKSLKYKSKIEVEDNKYEKNYAAWLMMFNREYIKNNKKEIYIDTNEKMYSYKKPYILSETGTPSESDVYEKKPEDAKKTLKSDNKRIKVYGGQENSIYYVDAESKFLLKEIYSDCMGKHTITRTIEVIKANELPNNFFEVKPPKGYKKGNLDKVKYD